MIWYASFLPIASVTNICTPQSAVCSYLFSGLWSCLHTHAQVSLGGCQAIHAQKKATKEYTAWSKFSSSARDAPGNVSTRCLVAPDALFVTPARVCFCAGEPVEGAHNRRTTRPCGAPVFTLRPMIRVVPIRICVNSLAVDVQATRCSHAYLVSRGGAAKMIRYGFPLFGDRNIDRQFNLVRPAILKWKAYSSTRQQWIRIRQVYRRAGTDVWFLEPPFVCQTQGQSTFPVLLLMI